MKYLHSHEWFARCAKKWAKANSTARRVEVSIHKTRMKMKTLAGVLIIVVLVSIISYQAGLRSGRRTIPEMVMAPSPVDRTAIDEPRRLRTFSRQKANVNGPAVGDPNVSVRYDLKPNGVAEPAVLGWGRATRRSLAELDNHPMERSEVFDANAMKDYQMRWEQRLRNPTESREPSFNPSAVQRLFDL